MSGDAEFSESERAELEKLEMEVMNGLESEADVPLLANDQGEPPEPVTEQQAPVAAQPATEPEGEPKQGDTRAALRAARRDAKHARTALEKANAELEELRKRTPATDPAAQAAEDEETVLSTIEADQPEIASVIKRLTAKVKQLEGGLKQQEVPSDPEFEPEVLPEEVQADVDETPELLKWQYDADQTAWQLAKKTDGLLMSHPKWKDATQADRLKEVARRVAEEIGTPTTPPVDPKEAARKVIEGAPARQRETLSDLRGGNTPPAGGSTDYSRMSDEEVINSL
jgi:hypothetical protein